MTISAKDILAAAEKVTKPWTRQRLAEEKGTRSRSSREYVYSDRVDFTEVAHDILPGAYLHATGGGAYTVSKRNFYYACREKFRELTGRCITYSYFADTLLVQYMNTHPVETASWKVTADPRGTLTIPNVGYEKTVPVGTIQVDNHLQQVSRTLDLFDIDATVPIEWPSLAEGQRYQGVLYIEKEGFDPMFREAQIAERFDLAIISCKGQSVVAARKFVDHVCAMGKGVTLFTLHDFDKYGFEIAQRLTTVSRRAEEQNRVKYRFKNKIKPIDLGLRLVDVQKYKLTGEPYPFKGSFEHDSITTPEERQYLRSGRRVELNELTAPQLIELVVNKLTQHLPRRFVPAETVLADAYRRALAVARINQAVEEVADTAIEEAAEAEMPGDLKQRLEEVLDSEPGKAWDRALYDLVAKEITSD